MTGGHPAEDRQAGFTVVELTVVAAIISLIAVFVATAVIGGLRTAGQVQQRTGDVASGQRALLQVTADLRNAESVESATPTEVAVRTRTRFATGAAPTDAPDLVTYHLVTGTESPALTGWAVGDLLVTRQPGQYGADGRTWLPLGAASPAARVLGGVVVPATGGRPLFSYLTSADSQAQCTTGATTSSLGAGVLSTAQRGLVFSVEVWLSVNSRPTLSPRPVTLSGGATLATAGPLQLTGAIATAGQAGIGQGCAP